MLSVVRGPVSCRAAQAGGMCRIINNALDYLCYAGPLCNQLLSVHIKCMIDPK